MDKVEHDKVKDARAGQRLILVQDGFDAVQCREEVSNEQSCEAEQRVEHEAEGHHFVERSVYAARR